MKCKYKSKIKNVVIITLLLTVISPLLFSYKFEDITMKESDYMTVTESSIKICGHGSETPSIKNMNTYLTTRYASLASNGKHKGVVKVMRLKALTDAGRIKFHDTYKTIIGRNSYNQSLRGHVYSPTGGKYYSDCSSSGMATFKKIGYNVSLLNTAGIYQSSLFEEVPVKISNGHITNPSVLKIGDCILFVGNDSSRPLQIGHVEYVYEIGVTSNKTIMAGNKVTVTATSLNVRKTASTSDIVLCKLKKGKIFTVKEIYGNWVKCCVIENNKIITGWVSKNYVQLT